LVHILKTEDMIRSSPQNTNRKSYHASNGQPLLCCSKDRKFPKLPLAHTKFGTQYNGDAAITYILVLLSFLMDCDSEPVKLLLHP